MAQQRPDGWIGHPTLGSSNVFERLGVPPGPIPGQDLCVTPEFNLGVVPSSLFEQLDQLRRLQHRPGIIAAERTMLTVASCPCFWINSRQYSRCPSTSPRVARRLANRASPLGKLVRFRARLCRLYRAAKSQSPIRAY